MVGSYRGKGEPRAVGSRGTLPARALAWDNAFWKAAELWSELVPAEKQEGAGRAGNAL
jgi:hypothetical protein